MQERKKITELEQIEMNKQVRELVGGSIKNLLEYLKQLPDDFSFSHETVFYEVDSAIQSGGTLIMLNYAVRHPLLFKFMIEHTSSDILEEAVLFQENIFDANTLVFIAASEYEYAATGNESTLAYLLKKISTEALNDAATSVTSEGTTILTLCVPTNYNFKSATTFFRQIVDNIDQVTIEAWLFSPAEDGEPMTIFQTLLMKVFSRQDHQILLLLLQKVSAEALNRYLSLPESIDFFILINSLRDPYATPMIDVLGHKIYQEVVEALIMRNFDLAVLSLAIASKTLFNGRVHYRALSNPIDVTEETNAIAIQWLRIISDKLLVKLSHELMTRVMVDQTPSMPFAQIATYNPKLFNAILHRLAKIEGWEAVYQRMIGHDELLKRLDAGIIKKFMIIHADFKDKIPDLTKLEGALFKRISGAYRNYKLTSRYTEAEQECENKMNFLKETYTAIIHTTPIIPPLAAIIIDYCIEEPELIKQANLRTISSELKSEKSSDFFSTLRTALPGKYFKFSKDSKGVEADTKLAHNLLERGSALPAGLARIRMGK